ncbi:MULTISPECIES: HU family DNA-binding protein [Vibrio]|uniref:HU family DNA-binding protein n=1 Tax=Vibrio TaxID=662 RepID=UPI00111CB602|nr:MULTISPECIES: HU family DNA-binding protein [Vibrio]MBS9976451.1 HU family DNA-binding protein [Vibrio alginolyticus]MBT0022577.1 HU family DNA-binding protein [Vibrio alginolyticus]NNN58868.1 HU family DNA-binding protein [Vibrio sp. 1-2 (7-a)]QOV28530.1 HU family DNA-binding protein [Vibrio diabolicus]TOP83793.1 integration host factor subunit alpha [Vibrio parahaemolyticus]
MIGKSEVSTAMAEQTGLTKALCRKVIESYLDEVLTETMSNGNAVIFTGVGRFEGVDKKPRMGRNVKTKEPIPIKPRRVLSFKTVKPFRARLMELSK